MADIFAVDGRNERAVQRAEHFVGDFVAGVLDVLEMPRLPIDIDVVVQQVVEQPCALERVLRASVEEVEETVVLRDKAQSIEHVVSRATVSRIARGGRHRGGTGEINASSSTPPARASRSLANPSAVAPNQPDQ